MKLKHIVGGLILASCAYGMYAIWKDSKDAKADEDKKKESQPDPNSKPQMPAMEEDDIVNPVSNATPTEAFDANKNGENPPAEPDYHPVNVQQYEEANSLSNSKGRAHRSIEGRKAKGFLYTKKGYSGEQLAAYGFDRHDELVQLALMEGWDGN